MAILCMAIPETVQIVLSTRFTGSRPTIAANVYGKSWRISENMNELVEASSPNLVALKISMYRIPPSTLMMTVSARIRSMMLRTYRIFSVASGAFFTKILTQIVTEREHIVNTMDDH